MELVEPPDPEAVPRLGAASARRPGRLPGLLLSLLLVAGPSAGSSAAPPDGGPGDRPGHADASVLFVGNSLISVHDLPETFRLLALGSARRIDLAIRTIAVGGALLSQHWEDGRVVTTLRVQRPDVLVLQAQSTEAVLNPSALDRHVRLFKKAADESGALTVILGTWARPARDPFYAVSASGGSPEAMQEGLDAAYAAIASGNGALLAPVGKAWTLAGRRRPEIALLDGSQHPSRAGTYLASAVLFQTLFGERALGSTFTGGLSPGVAEGLQRIAAELPLPVSPPVRLPARRRP